MASNNTLPNKNKVNNVPARLGGSLNLGKQQQHSVDTLSSTISFGNQNQTLTKSMMMMGGGGQVMGQSNVRSSVNIMPTNNNNIVRQQAASQTGTPVETTSRFNQPQNHRGSTIAGNRSNSNDVSMMVPAGNPSSNVTPQKRTGKKPQREIIQEVSESPEKHQEILQQDRSNLTSFQNYIIAKHSSPLTKLKNREGTGVLGTSLSPEKEPQPFQQQTSIQQPPAYHHHFHHGQKIYTNQSNQGTLEVAPLNDQEHRGVQKLRGQTTNPLEAQEALMKFNLQKLAEAQAHQLSLLNDSRTSDHSAPLFQPILQGNPNPPFNQNQESYMSPLRRDHGEQLVMQQNSEEKRRSRGQPSQGGSHQGNNNIQNLQNIAQLIHNASQQARAYSQTNQVRQSAQFQNQSQMYASPTPLVRASYPLNQSAANGGNQNNLDDSVLQLINGLGNQSFNLSQQPPNGLQGPALIQYYQNRYNMIQLAAQQLKQLQSQSMMQNYNQSFQGSFYGNTAVAQQSVNIVNQSALVQGQPIQTFATFDNLTPNQNLNFVRQGQGIQPFVGSYQSSPNRSRIIPAESGQVQCISNQLQRPQIPQNNASVDQYDLYKHLNKRIIQDFEHKPLNQIQSKLNRQGNGGLVVDPLNQSLRPLSQQAHFNQNTNFEAVLMSQLNQVQGLQLNQRNFQQAATYVQKYLKGFIIRRRFNCFAKLYFLFKRYQKRVIAKDVASALRDSYISVKSMRKQMLEIYVNKCATKIQKVFRGWFVRERIRPLKIYKLFSKNSRTGHLLQKMRALIVGWRLRKIMRTKDVVNFIRQIKDYQAAYLDINQSNDLSNEFQSSERRFQLQRSLLMSRNNTIQKMIMLIEKMQIGGLWLRYARENTLGSEQAKKTTSTRSLERGSNKNKDDLKSQSSGGGRRRNNAVMPALSHSKQSVNNQNNDKKNKYVTIEQGAKQQAQPNIKMHQRNNVQLKQTIDSASFNSMGSGNATFAFNSISQHQNQQAAFQTFNQIPGVPSQNLVQKQLPIQNHKPLQQQVQQPVAIVRPQGKAEEFIQNEVKVIDWPSKSPVPSSQHKYVPTPSSQNISPIIMDNQRSKTSVGGDQKMNGQIKPANITTYDEMPLMSLSRVSNAHNSSQMSKYSMERGRLEPNFKSDAYKEQAKEIFKRRMHYNPREAASRSKDRSQANGNSQATIQATAKQTVTQSETILKANENHGRNQNQASPSRTAQQPVPQSLSSFEKVASRAISNHKYPTHIHQQVIEEEKKQRLRDDSSSVSGSTIFQRNNILPSSQALNHSIRSSTSIDQTVNQIVQQIMAQTVVGREKKDLSQPRTPQVYSSIQQAQTPTSTQTPIKVSSTIKAYHPQPPPPRLSTIEEHNNKSQSSPAPLPTFKYYERPPPPSLTSQAHNLVRDVSSPLQLNKSAKPLMSPNIASQSTLNYHSSSATGNFDNYQTTGKKHNLNQSGTSGHRRTREERKKIKQDNYSTNTGHSGLQQTNSNQRSNLFYQSHGQYVDPDISMFDNSQKIQYSNRQDNNNGNQTEQQFNGKLATINERVPKGTKQQMNKQQQHLGTNTITAATSKKSLNEGQAAIGSGGSVFRKSNSRR